VTSCNRPDCAGGLVDETGFCETCSRRPLPPGVQPPGATTPTGRPQMAAGPWWGRSLVPIEEADEPEPSLLEGARLPAGQRICARCGLLVGRTGRDRGACPRCAARFDFAPPLRPGDLVDNDRYRVRGVLGHGGFGWAYLADDNQLPRRVVLKGVINDQVAATVEREMTHLAELENPYIVRIWGYVRDGRYLVLDYAGGSTVRPVGRGEPLAPLLALGLQLLEALDYLHGKGYLHCDVKPANLVRGGDRIRLIDFGTVRTADDRTPASSFTPEYCPGDGDPERAGPTPGFDLYCAGKTLAELCREHLEFRGDQPGVESLRLLLDRATHAEPERRFVSARQFAEQLSGVLRQVLGGPTAPHRSVVFGSMTQALHGGLGEVLPFERWVRARAAETGIVHTGAAPFACPEPGQVSRALPAVLPDPWDLRSGDTATTVEAQLNACHTALRQGNPAAAAARLDESALSYTDWRADWYRGLIFMALNQVGQALKAFRRVRAAVPGELEPLLALGLCAELQGDLPAAAVHYEMVSVADESLIAGHFGRARILLADGHRADAADALERVPRESRFEDAARIASIRALITGFGIGDAAMSPAPGDVRRAVGRRKDLDLDDLSSALLDAELACAELAGQRAAGVPSSTLRLTVERALRRLATFAPSERSHTALIDLANAVRPVTIWSW
jgi:serine/threonine-protein kinase PknG